MYRSILLFATAILPAIVGGPTITRWLSRLGTNNIVIRKSASTTTSSSGSAATSSSSSSGSSSGSTNQSWFSSHAKMGCNAYCTGRWNNRGLAYRILFPKTISQKEEKEIEMRPPVALGPHQLQNTTDGYRYGEGAINAAEGGHHKEAARSTVTSNPAEATRGKRESKSLQKKQRT